MNNYATEEERREELIAQAKAKDLEEDLKILRACPAYYLTVEEVGLILESPTRYHFHANYAQRIKAIVKRVWDV